MLKNVLNKAFNFYFSGMDNMVSKLLVPSNQVKCKSYIIYDDQSINR